MFSADGRRILTAGDTTAQPGTATGQLIQVFDKARQPIMDAKIDRDQSRIVTLIRGKPFVYIWNTQTGAALELSGAAAGSPDDGAHTEQVVWVAMSSDARRIVTASNDGTARIWDAETGAPINMLRYSTEPRALTHVAIRDDGRGIATTSRDGTAQLWPVAASPERLWNPPSARVPDA